MLAAADLAAGQRWVSGAAAGGFLARPTLLVVLTARRRNQFALAAQKALIQDTVRRLQGAGATAKDTARDAAPRPVRNATRLYLKLGLPPRREVRCWSV